MNPLYFEAFKVTNTHYFETLNSFLSIGLGLPVLISLFIILFLPKR